MAHSLWRDTDFKYCFANDDQCRGKIKSAHSIQNNRVLSRISEDGHVYTIDFTVENSRGTPEFKKISRNKASTFFGFCDYHDTEIFKPIEVSSYHNTEEQNFLFAYRGFCIGYHKVFRKMKILRNHFKKFPDSLLEPESISEYRIAQLDIRDGEMEFNNFTNDLRNKKYGGLETFTYTMDYEVNFAVSSCFAVSKDMNMNSIQNISDLNKDIMIPRLFVNFFPIEEKTVIILSYYKNTQSPYGVLFEQLRNSSECDLLHYLNYIVFNGTEDVYYRPSSIQTLNSKTKQSMLESYTSYLNPFYEFDLLRRNMHFQFNLFEI